jgi:hypothetical protein
VCAHARAEDASASEPAATQLAQATPAQPNAANPIANQATSAAPSQLDSSSPEAKAAAVPVDHDALLAPEDQTKAKSRDLESDPLFVPGAVLIGTGGAALLASLFTGLGAHGIYTSLEDDCRNNVCGSDKQHRIDSGKSLAVVSTVLTGVGIAAAGVGTVLMVLAATREEKPAPTPGFRIASLRLTGGPSPLGVGAAGSF